MAKLGLRHTSEVQTRDRYTKVNFELGMTLEGKELPTAAVLGAALEDAVKMIQDRITESFNVVPPRPDEVPANATVLTQPVVAQPVPVQPATVPATSLGYPPQHN